MSEARLGKYRILEEIGSGGYATVYRALDTTLDREVALKILHPPLLVDRSFVERFGREARALASLRHPHIVTAHEIAEAEGRLFIAMELARGPNLAQTIAEGGPMPWQAVLELLKPVCDALDYAHSQGVIHRDLKPTNILLDEERGALLSDFGFARLMSGSSVSLSLSGGVLGTPPYIAPEVWEFDAAEAPADIYALGCIVHEMLTGQVLFAGNTPMQVLRAHDRGPQFPETWPEGVPDGVETVLAKALARAPSDRYASVSELWHALKDAEAQAQASREAEERVALAAQWRAEAERAIATGEWGVARMTVGRWLAAMPEDPDARAALARIDEQQASERPPEPTPSPSEPSPTPEKRPRPGVAEAKPPRAKRDVSAAPAERVSPARPKGRWLRALGWVLAGLASVVLIIVLIVGTNGREKEVVVTRVVTQKETIVVEPTRETVVEKEVDATPTPSPEPIVWLWPDIGEPLANSSGPMMALLCDDGICTAEPDGGGLRTVVDKADASCNSPPALSPDGTRIAFLQGTEISIVGVDGKNLTHPITSPSGKEFGVGGPQWSPDGRYVVFSAGSSSPDDLYVSSIDGSTVTNITRDGGYNYCPDWSPDGQAIAFTSDRGGATGIYIINQDSVLYEVASDASGSAYCPRWSPDATRVAYVFDHIGADGYYDYSQIFVVDASGDQPPTPVSDKSYGSRPGGVGWGYPAVWVDNEKLLARGKDGWFHLAADGTYRQLLSNQPSGWCPDFLP